MDLIRDLFLWGIISFHVVGAAVLFRRYFPNESPWFGFLLPVLAVPLVLNFIEHFVAIPALLGLLPFTFLGLLFVVFRGGYSWDGLRLPTVTFLLAFGFTFGVRCFDPNISSTSDGLVDLSIVLNYSHGDKIPPTDSWLPTLDFRWYYGFQHYAASVLKRLLNVDGGTAVNASHSLLSAMTAFAGAAVAHRLSGGKVWVTLAVVFMIEAAFTGSSAYINLAMKDAGEWTADNLSGGFERIQRLNEHNLLWYLMGYDSGHFPHGDDGLPMRRELQVSGFWTWRDEYHANSSGHFFTLFSVFTVVELMRRERTIIPWICAIIIPPLVAITTMWLIIVDGTLCFGALVIALIADRRPAKWKWVAYGVAGTLIAVWPAFSDISTAPQGGAITWNPASQCTPLAEFLIQFWPVVSLWLVLFFEWEKMPLSARWVYVAIPFFLIGIELFNIQGDRYNTYEKMWGPVYSAALICFFPLVIAHGSIVGRVLAVLLLFCAGISFQGRLHNHGFLTWPPGSPDRFNLQGDGYLMGDAQRSHMLQELSQLHGATVMAGHCEYGYDECPTVVVFSDNRCYIAWYFSEERFGHGTESRKRADLNNDFYAGKCPDPLGFLTANSIDAVDIWPGDKIPDDLLAKLKTQLAPTYQYEDCREGGADNAGVFLKRPLPVIRR